MYQVATTSLSTVFWKGSKISDLVTVLDYQNAFDLLYEANGTSPTWSQGFANNAMEQMAPLVTMSPC